MEFTSLLALVLLIAVIALLVWLGKFANAQIAKRSKRETAKVLLNPEIAKIMADPDLKLVDSFELAEAAITRVFPDQDPEEVRLMFDRFKFRFAEAGGGRSYPSQSEISDLVRATSPPSQVDSVLAKLNNYGTKDYEVDREGIQLCILQLSGGDASKIDKLVSDAKKDFRDVLLAVNAHSYRFAQDSHGAPIDSKSLEAKTAKDKDLRSVGLWLLNAMHKPS